MQHGISTYLFHPQRLTPALLDTLAATGAEAIEVFAARHHFDYTDRAATRELALWFRSHPVAATLHMPLSTDEFYSRHAAPTLNLISSSKSTRIDTQDEVKRALEAAEQVPFTTCVLHLGLKEDRWDSRALDDSLSAIEHLKAFAAPLGVKLLLENLPNEVATPEHLVEIVRVGHFDSVSFCLDTGHAHLVPAIPETSHQPARSGIAQAFDAFGQRIAQLHLHDNHGALAGRDEHLWPVSAAGGSAPAQKDTIDWAEVARRAAALPSAPVGMLEIASDPAEDAAAGITQKCTSAWRTIEAQSPA